MSQTLITVIRHSLAAANAALDLLENSPQNVVVKGCDAVQHVVEAAPVVEAVEAPCSVAQAAAETVADAEESNTLRILLAELNNPRFRLRTIDELAEKAGIFESEVTDVLSKAAVAFVTKTRRSDRAQLIGLASRN